MESMLYRGYKFLDGIIYFWMAVRVWKTNLVLEDFALQTRTKMRRKWGLSWGLIDVCQWEWSVVDEFESPNPFSSFYMRKGRRDKTILMNRLLFKPKIPAAQTFSLYLELRQDLGSRRTRDVVANFMWHVVSGLEPITLSENGTQPLIQTRSNLRNVRPVLWFVLHCLSKNRDSLWSRWRLNPKTKETDYIPL